MPLYSQPASDGADPIGSRLVRSVWRSSANLHDKFLSQSSHSRLCNLSVLECTTTLVINYPWRIASLQQMCPSWSRRLWPIRMKDCAAGMTPGVCQGKHSWLKYLCWSESGGFRIHTEPWRHTEGHCQTLSCAWVVEEWEWAGVCVVVEPVFCRTVSQKTASLQFTSNLFADVMQQSRSRRREQKIWIWIWIRI